MDQSGMDSDQFVRSIEECRDIFEEQVIIKRYVSDSGGSDASGVAATPVYLSIKTKANITDVTARDIGNSNGLLATGDLRAEFRIPIFGGETFDGDFQTPGRRPDVVEYRNRDYVIVGHVFRNYIGSTTHYAAVLR